MSKTLFIDAVTSLGSGHLQLQRELAAAAASAAPANWKVILLQADHVDPTQSTGALKVLKYKHPGPSWIKRWLWFNRVLPTIAQNHNASVFFSLNGILSKNLISNFACIGTVNNMVPFTPMLMSRQGLLSKNRLRLALLRRQYTWSLKNAHSVLVHSQFALKQTEPWTGNIKNKSVICYTGIPTNLKFDLENPPEHPLKGEPYLLYVSALQWYKNHENLLRAYKKLLAGKQDPPKLVLAGPVHDKVYAATIMDLIKSMGLEPHVLFTGLLSRDDLPGWIYNAKINIFASLCETNSVILAETMGLYGVLLTSNREPMPEIAGMGAEYFDPENVTDMAEKIEGLLSKSNLDLQKKAAHRAKEFSWEKCGATIWEASRMAQENLNRF